MNSWHVARRAREIDPGFPIVYVTGVSADQWASYGVPNSILLERPFAVAQLVNAISNLLNRHADNVRPPQRARIFRQAGARLLC